MTLVQTRVVDDEPASSPTSLVLDPDDEAFGWEIEPSAEGDGPAMDEEGQPIEKGTVFTVKGVLKSVDTDSGILVVDQLLADGSRNEVRFLVDGSTHVGWSKATMKMSLDTLPRGVGIYVTYRVTGKQGERRNHAIKVIVPGGMEDVAKMILGEREDSTQKGEATKATKK